eukprot:CAMPEP_0170539138 /NCGR_PEP_ID=MMETSP0209-20121228/103739_1 /TAXON_ID=665100 ORGANISM="Litonotus pictus, Strain P1" /NCGR_SAMPLE_ID=MMETSP0209 /ASSEMBLY_ACC=CAM_ASM_000301 /LENGTH=441 /DNA_ID=CAMNT_0010840983 /DNA_START=52 /DNA_END=1374 /DNA_ORIENTATION=+
MSADMGVTKAETTSYTKNEELNRMLLLNNARLGREVSGNDPGEKIDKSPKKKKPTMRINSELFVLHEISAGSIEGENLLVEKALDNKNTLSSKNIQTVSSMSNTLLVNSIYSNSGVLTIEGNVNINNNSSEEGESNTNRSTKSSNSSNEHEPLSNKASRDDFNNLTLNQSELEPSYINNFDLPGLRVKGSNSGVLTIEGNVNINNNSSEEGESNTNSNTDRGTKSSNSSSENETLSNKASRDDSNNLTLKGSELEPSYINNYDRPGLRVKGSSFSVNDVKQWKLSSIDTFDRDNKRDSGKIESSQKNSNSVEGWSGARLNTCSEDSEEDKSYFLGGHCGLSSKEITKEYTQLPPHDYIKINALFHMFDHWEGEVGYMKVNNKIVWTKVGKSPKHGIDICGAKTSDPMFGEPIEVVLPHKQDSVRIAFGSTLRKDSCVSSFG